MRHLQRHLLKTKYFINILTCTVLSVLIVLTGCGQGTGAQTGSGTGSAVEAAAAQSTAETTAPETEAALSLEEQLKLAWNFLTEGNYKEAVLAFTAVIEIDPKNGDAYRGRAESYLGWAGTADSAEDYASYLALAAGDYDQAAQYLEDAGDLEAARKAQNKKLYTECMEKAHAAMEADDPEEMFEQMRRASLVEGAADLQFDYFDTFQYEYLPYIKDKRDADTAMEYCRLLMEITENSGLREDGNSLGLMMLESMVVGYSEQVFVTTDYIETIDRPILEFIEAHEEYLVSSGAIETLYRCGIALGEMDTAARAYALKVEKIHAGTWAYSDSSRSYDYGADGYSWTGTNKAGYRHETREFDIFGHCLGATAHLDKYDGPDGHVASDTDEVWTYEYESNGPRLLQSSVTHTNARGAHTTVRTYTYADGRLVQLDEFYTWTGEHGITDYSYSGMDVTVTYTGTTGNVRTEERAVNYNGTGALLK